MWNIAHPAPRNALKNTPKTPEAANIPMRRNITSPAYMFPNSRNECDNGLDTYSIMLNKKLAGQTKGLDPNGAQNKSCNHPFMPCTLIQK